MSIVEILLLVLVLVVATAGGFVVWFIRKVQMEEWRIHRQEMYSWRHYIDQLHEREFFDGRPSGVVRENLSSLQRSVSALSNLSESYHSIMSRLERRWADPLPSCSKSETIEEINKKINLIALVLKRHNDDTAEGGKDD